MLSCGSVGQRFGMAGTLRQEAASKAAWDQGKSMSLEALVSYALER